MGKWQVGGSSEDLASKPDALLRSTLSGGASRPQETHSDIQRKHVEERGALRGERTRSRSLSKWVEELGLKSRLPNPSLDSFLQNCLSHFSLHVSASLLPLGAGSAEGH